jgi:hypothetical protein
VCIHRPYAVKERRKLGKERVIDSATATSARPEEPRVGSGLAFERDGDTLRVWDPACGECAPCRAGLRALCDRPAGAWRARPLPAGFPDPALRFLDPAARGVDALVAAGLPAPAVAVCGEGEVARAVALVVGRSGARAVAVADGAADVRTLFAHAGGAGRADLALALDGDLAAAARLVRRGGAVASLVPPRTLPSVTALVQRELELVGPRDPVEALLAARLDELVNAT